jgi:hypothetical protein
MTWQWSYRVALPVLFFSFWAIAFTFPLVLHLGDGVVLARGGDAWLHIWDLWWVDKALVDLHQSPYVTNLIYYPTGLNLYYHSLDLFNGILSIPLQRAFNITVAFNLLMLVNLTLDGLAAYWLCLDRTGCTAASLVGGALFASSPLLGTSVDLGQLDEVTVWWVPLYILALWRALDSSGPVWARGGGRRSVLVAGICLAGASLATWYFAAGLVVFTVIFVPVYLLSRSRSNWLAPLLKPALAGVIFALLLSPLLWAMVRERLSGATYMLSTLTATVYNSADLQALFLPARVDSGINQLGSAVALGYLALLLSTIGVMWRWPRLWPVALATLAVIVMSLGPHLQIGGIDTGIPLPYALLNNVPFIGASRQPLRFLATASAGLALLSAFGAQWLQTRAGASLGKWGVTAALLLLIGLELFGLPRAITSTQPEPAFTFLRQNSTPGAVLEVPADDWSSQSLLHQTVHGRPIVGGYTSRHFPYPFQEAAPGVAQLVRSDPAPLTEPDILSPPVSQTALASLDHYNVRFIVVHKDSLATGRFAGLEQVLATLFAPKDIVHEDASVVIYRTPSASGQQPGGKLPLAGLGSGWYAPEANPLHRWTGSNVTDGNAHVWMGVSAASAGNYTLTMTVYAYQSPKHVSVSLDGRTLWEKEVGTDFEDASVDLGILAAGDHQVRLLVREQPINPPGDKRKIAIGVTRLAIERSGP